jgi:hypothetical protein
LPTLASRTGAAGSRAAASRRCTGPAEPAWCSPAVARVAALPLHERKHQRQRGVSRRRLGGLGGNRPSVPRDFGGSSGGGPIWKLRFAGRSGESNLSPPLPGRWCTPSRRRRARDCAYGGAISVARRPMDSCTWAGGESAPVDLADEGGDAERVWASRIFSVSWSGVPIISAPSRRRAASKVVRSMWKPRPSWVLGCR